MLVCSFVRLSEHRFVFVRIVHPCQAEDFDFASLGITKESLGLETAADKADRVAAEQKAAEAQAQAQKAAEKGTAAKADRNAEREAAARAKAEKDAAVNLCPGVWCPE